MSRSDKYGYFVDDNYILPFLIDTRLIFNRMIFTTEPIPRSISDVRAERHFLNQVTTFAKDNNMADFIARPQANAVFRIVPDDSEYVDWGSYIIDLTEDEEAIFAKCNATYRSHIRSAVRQGVIISTTNDVESIYRLIYETFMRKRELLYPSKSYLRRLHNTLGDDCVFYIATLNEAVQGCIVLLKNQCGGHYYYGGSIMNPVKGSIKLLHYQVMLDLKKNNVPIYDLMGARMHVKPGSKIEGIQTFKERFGGELKKGYTFRYVFNRHMFKLFNLMVRQYYLVRGACYSGDAIDQINALKRIDD